MRIIIVILSAAIVMSTTTVKAAEQSAKLTKVNIRFDTHNDNKDHDTILNVLVKNKVNMFLSQDIAEGLKLGGDMEFKDPSSHGFDLVLKSDALTLKDITLPVVNIHIQPNGHDRWIFDCKVTFIFSDGSSFSSH